MKEYVFKKSIAEKENKELPNSRAITLKQFFLFLLFYFFCFFLLYFVQWIGYPHFHTYFLQTPELCLSFLEQGKLYGGDPYCFQGPVTYIVAEILSWFFPLEFGMLLFYFATIFLTTFFIYLIKVRETRSTSSFFLCFICIFFFAKVFMDLGSLTAVLFLVPGYYMLFYTSYKRKELFSGFFLALSLFSKPHNTPLIIIPLLLFYLIEEYKKVKINRERDPGKEKNGIFSFLKQKWGEIFFLCIPFLVLFLLLLFFFPGFILYNYTIHTYNPIVQPFSSIFFELATFTYYYNGYFLLLYIGIFIAALRFFFFKKFDHFSFISTASFLLLIAIVGSRFSLYQLIDQFRYFLPFAPFYLIMIFKFGDELRRSRNKKCAAMLVIFLAVLCFLFYITLGGLTFYDFLVNKGINDQKLLDRVRFELEKPITLLPKPEGKILVAEDYYHRYDLLFDKNPFFSVSEEDFVILSDTNENSSLDPDMAVANNFIEAGILDSLEPYMHHTSVNYSKHRLLLQSGAYDILLTGPDNDLVYELLPPFGENYCIIKIPFFLDGAESMKRYSKYILFPDIDKCEYFINKVYDYYTLHFPDFCQRGAPFISVIQNALDFNNIYLKEECQNNKQLFLINNTLKVQALFFCVLLTGYLLFVFFAFLLKIPMNEN